MSDHGKQVYLSVASDVVYFRFSSTYGRRLQTADINTTNANVINHYVLGGGACNYPSSTAAGLLLLYSVDGGMTYVPMQSYAYASYRSPTEVTYLLPAAAKTGATRFVKRKRCAF